MTAANDEAEANGEVEAQQAARPANAVAPDRGVANPADPPAEGAPHPASAHEPEPPVTLASEPPAGGAPDPASAHEPEPPVTLASEPPGPVAATDSPGAAARKVMWTHVARLLDRDLEIRNPDHPDALRKYRVATRRLRSALRIFDFALPRGPIERLRGDLGDLAQAVGAVRDLDVRVANALAFAERTDRPAELLAPLIEAWRYERNHAYDRLVRRIETKRHRRFLERLARFVDDAPPNETMAGGLPPATVRRRAAAHVWEAYERVRGYSDVIRWADITALHRLRTETKRCRYTIEFLAEILGPDSGWLIQRLTAVQDHLGAINDAAVTAVAVRDFLEHRASALEAGQHAAIVAYLADRERETSRLRRAIGRAWRPVVSITFVRRLGRTVVIP